jgi:DNA polymerase III delta prime subunit
MRPVCYAGDNLDGFAEKKAQAILCGQAEPCEVCRNCIKVQNKSHPDLIYLREYKVKEIREIIATAAVRPNDGQFKVYIFANADTMRAECQNALLKFTEEPPDYVRIIFTAKSPDLLLDTIKSRLFFVNADSVSEAPHPTPELAEIAREFAAALSDGNEYNAACALSRIKTREDLSNVTDLISAELRGASTGNYMEIQKFLLNCIDDLKFNPNIALFCTHITAGICEKLKINTEET